MRINQKCRERVGSDDALSRRNASKEHGLIIVRAITRDEPPIAPKSHDAAGFPKREGMVPRVGVHRLPGIDADAGVEAGMFWVVKSGADERKSKAVRGQPMGAQGPPGPTARKAKDSGGRLRAWVPADWISGKNQHVRCSSRRAKRHSPTATRIRTGAILCVG